MSDAPERLWAAEDQTYSTLSFQGGTEYVRADITAAKIMLLQERVAELEAALKSIGRQDTTGEMAHEDGCGPQGDFEYAYDMLIKVASAALKGAKP